MKKLAIITSHPIQYNAPMFRLLAERKNIEIKVYYTWGKAVLENKYDPGFGKAISWDIPLLEGYDHEFVENTAKDPGSHHFKGIVNPALINNIKRWNADAVLLYGWAFDSHLKVMRYFHGKIPVLFRGDSTLLNRQKNIKSIIRKFFLKWVYGNVDIALYVGSHNKAYFINCGLKEQQLYFAPHAIDNKRFGRLSVEQVTMSREQRSRLGVKDGDRVFLYAGKLDANKNVSLLAAAFATIAIPGTHLIIAGNGEDEQLLRSTYLNTPGIHFLPFQNQQQMPVLYSLADVFVLPSKAETWGLGINEAMAGGKAILASSGCAAAADLVRDGANGYVFKSNDPASLIEKMMMLINDSNATALMGATSLQMIRDWNFEETCKIIEQTMVFK
ncbi:MAG: glycosyltransferase family 4 protein [Rhizobacter sp.]|nr:glycosyltransferase family 4 protein [Ferruginibacter sp.]